MTDRAVTILMATFDGALHLGEQLRSITAQEGVDWTLWASDDGSSDATLRILNDFAQAHPPGKVHVLEGPRGGPARNFLSLLGHRDLPEGPVALCDQDDVWMPDHLSRGLDSLSGPDAPALYACATLECDQNLAGARLSRAAPPWTGFSNALVQNVVSGNTMVLSPGAVSLLRAAMPRQMPPYHDWWIYALVTGAGLPIAIDAAPGLYYRQHGANALGASRGGRAFLTRLRKARGGEYARWLRAHADALQEAAAHLTPRNRATLATFRADLNHAGLLRGLRMARSGLHRETRLGTAMLYLAAGLGRI